jgi:outer membrane protein assembly factor BamB
VIRAAAVLTALAGLLVACSGGGDHAAPPRPEPPPTPPPARPEKSRPIYVSVIDGDENAPVRGAVVRIGRKRDRVSKRGVARFYLPRRGFAVTASARGYNARTLPVSFARRRWRTVRIYRTDLQWPLYGVNAARTQVQRHIDLRAPFRTVWSRAIGSLVEFPAVVSDGMAYIGNFHGEVRALSMRWGEVAWRRDLNERMAASAAVVGRTLVVHTYGHVWVLDRWNGRILWRYGIGSPIESSPVVVDGVDYLGSWNGNVYALDLRRHRLKWRYSAGYKITSSASVAGRRVFIGDYGGRITALAAGTGRRVWSRSVDGRVYGTPAVSHGRVFAPSSTGNSLTAFSTGGRYLWRVSTGGYVYSSPAVWRGRVYFGSYDGLLYCVSASRGSVLWTGGAGGPVSGAAVVVAGIVYAGSTANRITGFAARTGATVFRFPHGEYVPVSGNGQRLLMHGYSRIYAVEPRHR